MGFIASAVDVSEEELRQRYLELLRRLSRGRMSRQIKPAWALQNQFHMASHTDVGKAVGDSEPIFLNAFVRRLWPYVAQHVKNILYEKVEPLINSKLPSLLKGQAHFQHVSLGNVAPLLHDVVVLDGVSKDMVDVRLGVDLKSNLDATVVALGAHVHVGALTLTGELSLVFGPLIPKPPYFGGLEIFFVNPFDLSFNMEGNVIPTGLQPALHSAIGEALSRFMVLPNRIAINLDKDGKMDRTDLKYTDPIAVLRLTVLRANGLAVGDRELFGPGSSDPYVVVRCGATHWFTPTLPKTLNPVWGEDGQGVSKDLPLHSTSQRVSFQVYDADLAIRDDLIGELTGVEVLHIARDNSREVTLQLLDAVGAETAGTLVVTGRLMRLTEVPPRLTSSSLGGPSGGAYLAAKIIEVRGLDDPDEELNPPFRIRVACGTVAVTTHPSRARWVPPGTSGASKTCFDETVQLLLPEPAAEGGSYSVELQLLDKKGSVLGHNVVALADILQRKGLTLTGSLRFDPLEATLLTKLSLKFLEPC